jgi:hypothetical protein
MPKQDQRVRRVLSCQARAHSATERASDQRHPIRAA